VTAGDDGRLVIDVESDATLTGCPDCGVVAVGHGRRVQVLHDTPSFGRPVRVRWAKRIWRCPEAACPRLTWTEDHAFAAPRAKLSTRAVDWAVDSLRHDDTTVSAIARRLGVAWMTCWNAIQSAARTLVARPERVRGVTTIGVDEHIWRPSRNASKDKAVTVMPAGDPDGEVELAWSSYQRVHQIYDHSVPPARGRQRAEKLLESLHTCPIPEVARLGRTLRAWREQLLGYFATGGVSNGGTEAINGVIEKTRRLAHSFRNFTNYRLRILLAADGTRPYRRYPRANPEPC